MTPKCSTLGSAISTALSTGSTFRRSPPWIPGRRTTENISFCIICQWNISILLTQFKIALPVFRIAREIIKSWNRSSERVDQRTNGDAVIPIWLRWNSNSMNSLNRSIVLYSLVWCYREIINFHLRYLTVNPAQRGEKSRTVLLHEIGEISHSRQIIQIRRSQIFWLQNHRNVKDFLGQFHGTSTILHTKQSNSNSLKKRWN